MKYVLLIHGAKCNGGEPTRRYIARMDEAISFAREHVDDDIVFVTTGRWPLIEQEEMKSEARVGSEYIHNVIPEAVIFEETISVETIGNLAFSKPLIKELNPDELVIFGTELMRKRYAFLTEKVWADELAYQHILIEDEISVQNDLQAGERHALQMAQQLLKDVASGNDGAIRELLLTKTPYYVKGVIDDQEYFNQYWPGGYAAFLERIRMRNETK